MSFQPPTPTPTPEPTPWMPWTVPTPIQDFGDSPITFDIFDFTPDVAQGVGYYVSLYNSPIVRPVMDSFIVVIMVMVIIGGVRGVIRKLDLL